MNVATAVRHINRRGMLLVFPSENRKEPPSLWFEFFPRTKMRWEWDQSGDNHVAELWHLRARLSTSKKVIYSKWYRDKATLISLELFTALLRILNPGLSSMSVPSSQANSSLSFNAREVLDLLEEDSPLSTKQLKKFTGLQGREAESVYRRALKELWRRQLIVVCGEVDEGAFPSIAIGATKVLFEEQWKNAIEMEDKQAEEIVARFFSAGTAFDKFLRTLRKR